MVDDPTASGETAPPSVADKPPGRRTGLPQSQALTFVCSPLTKLGELNGAGKDGVDSATTGSHRLGRPKQKIKPKQTMKTKLDPSRNFRRFNVQH